MFSQIVILIVPLLSIIGIGFWFSKEKHTIDHIHRETTAKLESAICLHRRQMDFRNSHLNHYDFLEYNLDEALVRQPEIDIK